MTRHKASDDDATTATESPMEISREELPDEPRTVQVHTTSVPDEPRTVKVQRTPAPAPRMTIEEYVKLKLAEAPPLTQAQRDRIATLLWSGS